MERIIATDSCHSQQLKRGDEDSNLQPMVANCSKDDFAARLNAACDQASPVIPQGRGRRAELRRRVENHGLAVSGESVRKWLSGDSIPSMDNVRYIAKSLSVNTEWLLTGRGKPSDQHYDHADTPKAADSKTADYFPSQHIRDVVTLMKDMDEAHQAKVLFAAQLAKHEYQTERARNSSQRVG